MKKNYFVVVSALFLTLASCGGGSGGMRFEKSPGEYKFPALTPFVGADTLPELGENEIVAFCPVSAGYTNVYNWTRSGTGDTPFAAWPGSPLVDKYDANWYQVKYQGYDDLWIIFNGSGQTQDMHMTHAGYWWFWESDKDMHDTLPSASWLDSAKFVDEDTIRIVGSTDITKFSLYEGDKELISGNPGYNAVDVKLGGLDFDLDKGYSVKVTIGGKEYTRPVAEQALYATDKFNQKYAYTGDDLGLTYSPTGSTFKVWSPFSSEVKLRIYGTGTPEGYGEGGSNEIEREVAMAKGDHGVWSVSLEGDLNGKYYTYVVTNKTYTAQEIVDPYARSAGINGLRGMILDLSKTNPEGWDSVSPHQTDRKGVVVYESHIADLTSADSWNGSEEGRRKYAGFHESGTTYTKGNVTVKTGFDHIKELGVNAVQILPMFDQANDERVEKFNWGYNPLNYNVPEGLYSSNPYDGAVRVKEMKAMIADYTKAGINIIMDVVYNHVAGAIQSNFDVLFPGYYFRYNDNGSLANGSGCGNETASDHYMFRKFMIDSVAYWAKEYKLGGFRFDLMGLHDVETMNLVTAKAKTINPGIIIYGEPWQGGTSPLDPKKAANQANGNDYVGYGQFNDGIRDALLKGGLNPETALGWGTDVASTGHAADAKTLAKGVQGFTVSAGTIEDPDKTVTYITCHDNYTLHDRIALNRTGRMSSLVEPMAMLCGAVTLTSQGTAFMLSGDEFLRSKRLPNGKYDHNSYESSYEVNQLDWDLKVTNLSHFENYKKLIELKKTISGLHMDKAAAKNWTVTIAGPKSNALVYEVTDASTNKTYKIAHQACFDMTLKDGAFVCTNPATIDFSGYEEVVLDTFGSDIQLSATTQLAGGQTLIAVK